MSKKLSNFIFLIIISFVFINCANRGTPTGGEKDVTPPVITKSSPDNFTTNFKGKEIKIYFDEYIKINNLQKQLIISPPMDPEPEITPLGTASKYITIKIHDTLQENTTYAFNFGESIVDNNEGNPYPYYKYVFSTGSYIDSLSVSGIVTDALDKKPEEFVSVMLYEVNDSYTDSIIYKEKPKYVSSTLDSTSTFKLENLKAGKYLMVALKEENSNYTYQQKTDKIGFRKEFITVPSDTAYVLNVFKEEIDFKATRPKLVSGNKIAFGYEGSHEGMQIKPLSQLPNDFKSQITKDPDKDTLNFWYKPKLEVDSLIFEVSNKKYRDTLVVKIKDQERDSLIYNAIESRVLKLKEDFQITSNLPNSKIDNSKIKIMDKDSVNVPFTSSYDKVNNISNFKFDKTEGNTYKIEMLPGALTDFFGTVNDTLNYNLRTRQLSDYGNVRVLLKNAKYPVVVQLTSEKGEVKYEKTSTKAEPLDFNNLDAGNYLIRVIFDTNGNGKFDTGNFLKKQQPERVSYFPEVLDVRAGWDLIQEFVLID
ncbi:Ig-like domain-containing protein [Pontimicrobium sp. IMCC45349]|uniref:Ig-like domain-containing protein n=1 Tax=Pontimicrobium sp. IMCC45349 TaxID=3391574 RepID=UPI00399F8A4E